MRPVLMTLLVAFVALASCAKSKVPQKSEEGFSKIDQMSAISRSLSQKDVFISTKFNFDDSVEALKKMNDEELNETIKKLEQYVSLSHEVVDIMNSKEVETKLDPSSVKLAGKQAARLLQKAKSIQEERQTETEDNDDSKNKKKVS